MIETMTIINTFDFVTIITMKMIISDYAHDNDSDYDIFACVWVSGIGWLYFNFVAHTETDTDRTRDTSESKEKCVCV